MRAEGDGVEGVSGAGVEEEMEEGMLARTGKRGQEGWSGGRGRGQGWKSGRGETGQMTV